MRLTCLYLMLSMVLKIFCSSISSPLLYLPLFSSLPLLYLLSISLLPSLSLPPPSLPPCLPLPPSLPLSLFPSLPELSQDRGLTCDDIISTLQYYSLLKYWKGKHIIIRRKVRLPEHGRGTKVFFHKTIQWNPFYDGYHWQPKFCP